MAVGTRAGVEAAPVHRELEGPQEGVGRAMQLSCGRLEGVLKEQPLLPVPVWHGGVGVGTIPLLSDPPPGGHFPG